jgi:hypothetical protein
VPNDLPDVQGKNSARFGTLFSLTRWTTDQDLQYQQRSNRAWGEYPLDDLGLQPIVQCGNAGGKEYLARGHLQSVVVIEVAYLRHALAVIGCMSVLLRCERTNALYCTAIISAALHERPRLLLTETNRPWPSYVQRLFYNSRAAGLRRGQITTVLNGRVVTLSEAEPLVRCARQNGWIVEPPSLPGDRGINAEDLR